VDTVNSGGRFARIAYQGSSQDKGYIMKSRLLISCLVAGALMAPVIGYAADGDSDRSSPKAFVKDSVITTKIKAQLAEEKMSSLVRISVDTDANGMVYLSGSAASQAAVDKAVSIARNVKGVKSVQNTIQVKADK
jgi:hyperosmotically inducible protein